MNRPTFRHFHALALTALLCLSGAADARAPKKLKKGDAQKLIAALSLLELNKGVVVVKEITPTGAGATVLAGVRVAFRFARDEKGVWRADGVRTGDRQWEDFDLLARAAGRERVERARAALDSLAAELESLARETSENQKKDKDKDKDQNKSTDQDKSKDKGKNKDKKKNKEPDPPDLVRGALRVQKPAAALSAMGKTAVVEAEVEATFEIVNDAGKWRVASAAVAGERVQDFDAIVVALDADKAARARADLESLAAALEAYRRERGFYVVSDSGIVLVDHLNPRYTKLYTRFDPWHRAYEYEGAPDRFLLRSNGPDGKPNTGDDVTIRKG